MLRFALKRGLYALVTLWLLVSLVFVLVRLTGDPTTMVESGDPQFTATLKAHWGLDRSYLEQYGLFLRNLVQGDFGISYQKGTSVAQLYFERIPYSLKLGFTAFLLSVVIGVPLGILSATKVNTVWDRIASAFAVLGLSVPNFVIGLMMIVFFGVRLNLLPVMGAGSRSFDLSYLIMPAVALGWYFAGSMARITRSSMLEVLRSDYIKLVRLKGVPERTVMLKHALTNATIPILTLGGINLVVMVNVAVPIEVVFSWPGIGRLLFEAMLNRDFPLVQGIVLMTAIMILILNFVIDLLYAFIDPRIRLA
jgi:peptide/nickel transport system permease protein